METNNTAPGIFDRLNTWIQESIMIKLFSIGILIIILLIPSAWIETLIYERQSRADQVIDEVADKWSGEQKISGPVLVIPYQKHEVLDLGKAGKEIRTTIEKAFFLPEDLNVKGKVDPEILHRGIFDAVVYHATIDLTSKFSKPDFQSLNIDVADIVWNPKGVQLARQ